MGFLRFVKVGGERESRKKHSKSFIFPISMFVGKKKIHSAVQNDTVLGFFILYMNSE
jgi:hypothetical protein